jgi:hypothetical protein
MSNKIIDMYNLVTITCTRLDHTRKWWEFWKPKKYWTEHYTARVNRTGQCFKCPPEVVGQLIPILEAMEVEIRRELLS